MSRTFEHGFAALAALLIMALTFHEAVMLPATPPAAIAAPVLA